MENIFRIRASADLDVWFTRVASDFRVEFDGISVDVRGVDKDSSFQTVTLTASRTSDVDADLKLALGAVKGGGANPEFMTPSGFLLPAGTSDNLLRLLDESVRMLSAALHRVGSILRWRYHLAGNHSAPHVRALEIEFENEIIRLPVLAPLAVGDHEATVDDDAGAVINAILTDGAFEPIGHELLREARANRFSHPRSALVIGYAAAECGFKEFAGSLVPQARWLLEKAPTPPLAKMLKEYAPDLPVRQRLPDGSMVIPTVIRRAIARGAELRNVVAHAGREEPTVGEVETLLNAVSDLLYLFDFYAGHEWAIRLVSEPVLAELPT